MKAKIVGISILGAVVAAIAAAILFVGPIDVATPKETEDPYEGWNRSGPFAINKFEYKIGENVFISISGLKPHDVGNMVFVMPNGTTKYITIQFDGSDKSDFNQYFKPSLSKGRKICSANDLAGEWSVIFQGTNYESLRFRILNETMPTEASIFERVC